MTKIRTLSRGDRLYAHPCEIIITRHVSPGDTVTVGYCYSCKIDHIIDVRRYEGGNSPWKPVAHAPKLDSADTLDFPESTQDLANVLYDLGPQPRTERYIDYAQRLVDALAADGYLIVSESQVEGLLQKVGELVELVGKHDPTGEDHMEEMWEHAQRADAAEAEAERLQRRCEIYAAGITAIADPLPGWSMASMVRAAQNTLEQVRNA